MKAYAEFDPNETKPFGKARAVADGHAVRAVKRQRSKSRELRGRRTYKLDADQVLEIIRAHVRKACGDWMENNAKIYAHKGYFFVKLPYRRPLNIVADDFWRKSLRDGVTLRRQSLGLLFRALRGEELTA